jgi:hypothetical protein
VLCQNRLELRHPCLSHYQYFSPKHQSPSSSPVSPITDCSLACSHTPDTTDQFTQGHKNSQLVKGADANSGRCCDWQVDHYPSSSRNKLWV